MTDTFLQKAKALLAIESVDSKPEKLQEAIDFVVRMLEEDKSITVEHFSRNNKPSLLAYYGKTRPEKFKIIFNGHIDVVPGTPEQFRPYVKNGNLYGRGAADMKVAALVMTEVFMKEAKNLPYPVGLQIVTDEEIGGFDGTAYQIEQGVAADFVIAGEDIYEGTICTEMRGFCWVDVEIGGESGHGGYVWRGDNAIVKAQDFTQKLLTHYPIPAEETWATTVNIASFNTPNDVYNRIPDAVTMRLDIRYIPDDPHFADQHTAQSFLQNLCPDARITFKMFESSHKTPASSMYVKQLMQSYQDITGDTMRTIKKYGGADVRFYSANGMQAVTFGLPDHNTHSQGEFIPLLWIDRYRKVLSHFLAALY